MAGAASAGVCRWVCMPSGCQRGHRRLDRLEGQQDSLRHWEGPGVLCWYVRHLQSAPCSQWPELPVPVCRWVWVPAWLQKTDCLEVPRLGFALGLWEGLDVLWSYIRRLRPAPRFAMSALAEACGCA